MKICLSTLTFAACALMAPIASQAQTEIQWWHAMSGPLGDWVGDLAKGFNDSQKEYKVVATYKGTYDDSMAAGIAAYRAGNAPNIMQVFEVGTATMMASKGAIVPVWKMMEESGQKFDEKSYIPAVASYYTASNGKMLSLPFNSSTTVFFYNKDAFKAAGLDPSKPPLTWAEVKADAVKLKASGSKCPLTTSWQSWTQLESFSAWHNVPFATHNNGFGGTAARLEFNGPLQVRHIQDLADMEKQGLFVYKGRGNVPDAAFISGECAMSMGSSSTYGQLKNVAKFAFALSPLPYYADVKGAPQNTIIGGASLWAMSGKPAAQNKGVAAFFAYLSSPEVQAASHQRTVEAHLIGTDPGTDVAVNQMVRKTTDKSRGIRLGSYLQVRAIEDEELEQVWSGKKTAKQALDSAVERSNVLLAKFQQANKD